jgi:hypothetical protein
VRAAGYAAGSVCEATSEETPPPHLRQQRPVSSTQGHAHARDKDEVK